MDHDFDLLIAVNSDAIPTLVFFQQLSSDKCKFKSIWKQTLWDVLTNGKTQTVSEKKSVYYTPTRSSSLLTPVLNFQRVTYAHVAILLPLT